MPSKVSYSAQISCCNHGPLLKSSYPFLPHDWPLVSAASLREDPQSCNGECDWFANLLNSWWQLAWIKHTWHICSTLFLSCDSFQFWSQRKNLAGFAWQKSISLVWDMLVPPWVPAGLWRTWFVVFWDIIFMLICWKLVILWKSFFSLRMFDYACWVENSHLESCRDGKNNQGRC